MKLCIITGASKGIGRSLAYQLEKDGNKIINLSRSSKDYSVDLSDVKKIQILFENIFLDFKLSHFHEIILINNAGMIAPISPIGSLDNGKILENIKLNLVAPIVLTNEFINHTREFSGPIKIINISSGVAKNPKPSWSTYSAAKAGLENFSSCLSKELPKNYEVYCIDPGIVDTEMQAEIRGSSKEDFPDLERFQKFKEEGLLNTPEHTAKKILKETNLI